MKAIVRRIVLVALSGNRRDRFDGSSGSKAVQLVSCWIYRRLPANDEECSGGEIRTHNLAGPLEQDENQHLLE
jgi:hypothetical protein